MNLLVKFILIIPTLVCILSSIVILYQKYNLINLMFCISSSIFYFIMFIRLQNVKIPNVSSFFVCISSCFLFVFSVGKFNVLLLMMFVPQLCYMISVVIIFFWLFVLFIIFTLFLSNEKVEALKDIIGNFFELTCIEISDPKIVPIIPSE